MNQNYEVVKDGIQTGNGAPEGDFHEMFLINGGETALHTIYEPFQYDLTAYNITSNPSWLQQGSFQEVNVSNGEVIFEWNSIDYVPLSASYVRPGDSEVAGNGTTEVSAWDYFHINSVDKSSMAGHYLISARHVSAVYCIDGNNGSIIWTLSYGAENNTFEFSDFNFTFQHDARFVSENDTHTIISLFNNGSNDFNRSATQSSGMVISLDLVANTATLVNRTFGPRPGGILAGSQSNYQLLETGGTFIGWGSVPAVSETNAAGEYVFFAEFGSHVYNYRAYMHNWTGYPPDQPALATAAQPMNSSEPLVAYIPWNGATEVIRWRFWGSINDESGFSEIGSADKSGFETRWSSQEYTPFIFAEALASDDLSLGNSSVVSVARVSGNGTIIQPSSSPLPSSIINPTTAPTASGSGAMASPSQTGAAVRQGGNRGSPSFMLAVLGGLAMAIIFL